MSKIVHRAILDLFNLGMTKELEDMWCNVDVGHDGKPILDQVFFSLPFHLHIFMQTIPSINFPYLKCF
jgi:hypothetical protein